MNMNCVILKLFIKSSLFFKKSYRKYLELILWVFLTFISCAPALNLTSSDDTDSSTSLKMIAIDVGQGDGTLIITPSQKVILIDAGPLNAGREKVLPLLESLGLSHINLIFSSQYDADHIAGIAEVISGDDKVLGTDDDFTPDAVYDRGGEKVDAGIIFDNYIETIASTRHTLQAGDRFDLGDGVTIDCLVVNGITANGTSENLEEEDENGRSHGLLLTYGNFRYFTAGDLTGGGPSGSLTTADMESLVATQVGTVDLLHINHHGSQTSSNETYLDTLNPSVALISTGDDNTYGHPHSAVLNRLEERGIVVYQTENGNGGSLPSAHIAEHSILISVSEDGTYTVDGDEYTSLSSVRP